MPMPVLIGAFAESGEVLFLAPTVHPKFMSCIESLTTGQVYHISGLFFLKSAQKYKELRSVETYQ
jgi:hypothetical protein